MRVESRNDYGVNATEGESGERNLSLFRGEEKTLARREKLHAISRDLGWDGSLCATGPESAEIAIVGQAYGSHDEAEDQPLSGPSGKLIKDLMRRAGVDWTKLYITNISKIRPPGDKWELLPRPVSDFIPILIHELSSLPNLKLIVPCGRIPLEILCGKDGIDKYRGSILECTLPMINHVKCIPTYNPAEIFHKYWKSWVQIFDFKKIKEESTYADLRLPEYEFHYAESADEISDWLRRNAGKTSSVDTETYQPLQISCMSISQSPFSAFSIPFFQNGRPKWTTSEEVYLYRELDKFFASTPTVMQNAMYDLFVFQWLGYSVPAEMCVMDTMLAHCCIYPELPHGLDFLDSIYTRQPYYKDEGKVWHSSFSFQQLRRYNCLDAATTFDCGMQLREELKEFGLEEFFREQYMEMISPLLASSLDGIRISTRQQLYIREVYNAARNSLQEEVNDLVGHEINVGSSPQMCKYLYEELNLPPKYKKDKDGNQRITADETALQKLAREHENPGLRKIVSLRRVRKVISTYIDIPYDSDYRIRCTYNLMGTNTGRISEGPCPTGSGMTLHNLPRSGAKVKIRDIEYNLPDVKEMLIADEGHTIFRPDYKQAEVYIVAAIAEEPVLLELLFSGRDIHRFVASEFIYKKPAKQITSMERYLAKRTVHASNYGMSWVRFSDLLSKEEIYLPAKEVKRMLESYHRGFPQIRKKFQRSAERQLQTNRTLRNCFGRQRLFLGRLDDETFRKAYAFIPQGTVADLLNRALKKVALRYPIKGQQHDSMWVQLKDEEIEEGVKYIVECMNISMTVNGINFTIPVEMKYGKNLADNTEMDVSHLVGKENG